MQQVHLVLFFLALAILKIAQCHTVPVNVSSTTTRPKASDHIGQHGLGTARALAQANSTRDKLDGSPSVRERDQKSPSSRGRQLSPIESFISTQAKETGEARQSGSQSGADSTSPSEQTKSRSLNFGAPPAYQIGGGLAYGPKSYTPGGPYYAPPTVYTPAQSYPQRVQPVGYVQDGRASPSQSQPSPYQPSPAYAADQANKYYDYVGPLVPYQPQSYQQGQAPLQPSGGGLLEDPNAVFYCKSARKQPYKDKKYTYQTSTTTTTTSKPSAIEELIEKKEELAEELVESKEEAVEKLAEDKAKSARDPADERTADRATGKEGDEEEENDEDESNSGRKDQKEPDSEESERDSNGGVEPVSSKAKDDRSFKDDADEDDEEEEPNDEVLNKKIFDMIRSAENTFGRAAEGAEAARSKSLEGELKKKEEKEAVEDWKKRAATKRSSSLRARS